MGDVLELAADIYGVDKGKYVLSSPTETTSVNDTEIAGDRFEERLWLCKIPNTPSNKKHSSNKKDRKTYR